MCSTEQNKMLFSRCSKYLTCLSPSFTHSGYQPYRSYGKLLASVFCVAVLKSVLEGICLRESSHGNFVHRKVQILLNRCKRCFCTLLLLGPAQR